MRLFQNRHDDPDDREKILVDIQLVPQRPRRKPGSSTSGGKMIRLNRHTKLVCDILVQCQF